MTPIEQTSAPSMAGQFYRDSVKLLLSPGEFYGSMTLEKDTRAVMTFLCLTAIFYSTAATVFAREQQAMFFFQHLANGLIMPFVTAGLLFPVLYAAGSKKPDFGAVLGITVYANAALLLAWIPGMAPFAEIFRYYLIGTGAAKTGNISGLRAFLVIVVLVVLLFMGIQAFRSLAAP